MSKLRLVFVKEHQASYISHLDVMRTFQRVFPRAGLSIKHSNGFHPHPILSIVLPLCVTMISVLTLYYAVGHWNSYFNAFLYLTNRDLI